MASHVLGESILSQKLAHEIGQVKLEDLGFVDETGSNLAMTRRGCPFLPRQLRL